MISEFNASFSIRRANIAQLSRVQTIESAPDSLPASSVQSSSSTGLRSFKHKRIQSACGHRGRDTPLAIVIFEHQRIVADQEHLFFVTSSCIETSL